MDERVNLETWPRRELFDFFGGVSNPYYMVTFRQDVTALYRYAKGHGLSFYYALVYCCTRALNQVEAFRYTIRGGEVYRLAERMPSFTDLKKGSEQFHVVTMPCKGTAEEFCKAARERSDRQQKFIDQDSETDSLIYFSCLPWVDVTAITNERELLAPDARDDSIPRLAWGKYRKTGDRVELGISVEVNHRLIDGLHIGRFAQALTEEMDRLEQESGAEFPGSL